MLEYARFKFSTPVPKRAGYRIQASWGERAVDSTKRVRVGRARCDELFVAFVEMQLIRAENRPLQLHQGSGCSAHGEFGRRNGTVSFVPRGLISKCGQFA